MDYETIEYEVVEEGIGVLSLNRPRKYNSVNHQMMEELEGFWKERLYDLDTHVIILRGNGKRGFCAGLDMKEALNSLSIWRTGTRPCLSREGCWVRGRR